VRLKLRQIPRGEELRKLLDASRSAHGLILDLRNCTGGFLESSLPIVSFLLGAGSDFYQIRPRQWRTVRIYASDPKTEDVSALVEQGVAVQLRTYDYGMRFSGTVAVLVSEFTASEAEEIAAALQESGRGRVFGRRSNGAFNGWSQAIGLPHNFGSLAIPFTRTLTALGHDLEGIGVEPEEAITNSPEDLQAGRDRVLTRALAFLRASAQNGPAAR
jgi:C-terminal processing protease CtpA/Prc